MRIASLTLALVLSAGGRADAGGLGFHVGDDATDKDIGVPVYPGARVQPRTDDESAALSFAFHFGSTRVRLSLVKYLSDDAAAKVTEFYRKELGKFGVVSDCATDADDADDECDPADGATVLRVGSKRDRRTVAISEQKKGTKIVVVRLRRSRDAAD